MNIADGGIIPEGTLIMLDGCESKEVVYPASVLKKFIGKKNYNQWIRSKKPLKIEFEELNKSIEFRMKK